MFVFVGGMIIPYVEFCPAQYIETALVPLMPYVLDALYQVSQVFFLQSTNVALLVESQQKLGCGQVC